MAFDNLVLNKITSELSFVLKNSYIDNVFALSEKQFAISFHGSSYLQEKNKGRGTLIIYYEPGRPFITYSLNKFTKVPLNTPFFNSLKKLIGTKICNVEKEKGERIITITTMYNDEELGRTIDGYKIIFELFPSKPNIILTAVPNNKIISVYKEESDITSKRPLIRNTSYEYPPERIEFDFNIMNLEEAKTLLSFDVYKRLSQLSECIGFQKAKEFILLDKHIYAIEGNILPSSFNDKNAVIINIENIYELYVKDQKKEANKLKEKDLINKINSSLKSAQKKLKNLEKDYKDAESKIIYKDYGNLLFQYQLEYSPKMTFIELEGIRIELDPKKDLVENANLYFKKYKKAKQALIKLAELQTVTKDEIEYLKKKLLEVENSGNKDIQELKEELVLEGYLKAQNKKGNKKEKHKSYKPHILQLNNNVRIGYGVNGFQNEELTFKVSTKNDIFLHVKDYPGAHVILLDGVKDNKSINLAAEFALFLSKLDSGEVMYTKRKYVKKNPTKIGLVNILKYQTINIKTISKEHIIFFESEFNKNK